MKRHLGNWGKTQTVLQDMAKQQHFAQKSCFGYFRMGYCRSRISSILFFPCSSFHSLPLSLTSLCAVNLCLQPLAIQLCFQHLWKALSCSGIVLDKLARITQCVKDLLCGSTRISRQHPPCFIPPPPPQHHAHRHAGTHTCCVMVQFNPESTGFVSYPSNRTAGGDGESLQLPNKALSKLEERIPF